MPLTIAKDIAVIGRSCRLPGAASIDQLWTLLSSGTCAVSRIPADRWSLDRLSHPRVGERGKSYTWAAGTLDDVWGFDPSAFGLAPREAEQMDPQQRLLLELTWEALEDAGLRPSAIAGSDAGVFVGASALDYGNLRILDAAAGDAYLMTGNTLSIISNRISYIFDLHGPSLTVDTACSSALVALNEAVMSLRSGRVDTAIVGGVNVLASPFNFIGFSQAAMLSRIGLCQAFSAQADGYVRAEGGVVLVLRRREVAEQNGDHIHGFIVASDVNSDGRTNGISLPSKIFQSRLLEDIYFRQGLDPSSLAFVEAHGTGTRVGDPIEASAIGETLARKRREPLLIGSIKTNIGHMEAASGLGGVLKAMLALEHDQLPPSLHSEDLNPDIDFDGLNLRVARELTPLTKAQTERRIAGINSFGFGGTNAHVVVADGPRALTGAQGRQQAPEPSYLIISAQSRNALNALAAEYKSRLEQADDDGARAIVSAAAFRRERLQHRFVVPMNGRQDLVSILDGLDDEQKDVTGVARGVAVEREAPVAFVFSGNGSQFAGMGIAAYARNAHFRERMDQIADQFASLAGWSIVDALHDPELATKLTRSGVSQPLLFAIQSAASHALKARGLEPAVVLGHSVGEVAAAEAAGILDSESAIRTIFHRSLHQELTYDSGGMAVVIASFETTQKILAELPTLEIAAYNSPRAFTVSGGRDDIDKLSGVARNFQARIRKLDLAYPFHSAYMAPVEQPLLENLAGLRPTRSTIPFASAVTGAICNGSELGAHYWWRNVREPVHFSRAIEAAANAGARIFVEIGPTASLLAHIGDCIDERSGSIATLCALEKKDRGDDPIASAVGLALARGADIDDDKAFGGRPAAGSYVPLPLYPWQRQQFRLPDSAESPGLTHAGAWHPLIGSRYSADRFEWHSTLDTYMYPSLADHNVDGRPILPGAAFTEMALAVARDWLGTSKATIADLEIVSPMVLGADASREVMCRLSPLISHLEILSRPRLGQTPWQTHATAKIIRDTGSALPSHRDDHAVPSHTHVVNSGEIYAMASRAGLRYGPSFQKLLSARINRPDQILLDLTKEAADPAYGVDPARMDACFHALVLIFSHNDVRGTAFIPVRFGEIVLMRPGATFSKARIDILRRDERIIIANFVLTDEEDDVIVFIREARFQAIRTSRGFDLRKEMIAQTLVLASEPTAIRNDRPLALATLRSGLVDAQPNGDGMTVDFVLLEGWATAVALNMTRELATADCVNVDTLVKGERLPEKARPWLENVFASLDRSGLLHKDEHGHHVDTIVELPDPDEILRTIAAEHQNLTAELLIAASTGSAIKALVARDFETFGRPLSPKLMDAWELGSSQAHSAATALIDLIQRSKAAWPQDRAMRILQIGYGPLTSLTAKLIEETEARLTILDSDGRRLERAKIALDSRGDITFVDKASDLPTGGFDFIIAAHVLYRYAHEPALWSSLRRAMAQGAIFAAIEPAPSFFHDLAFGLRVHQSENSEVPTGSGLSIPESDWRGILRTMAHDAEVATISTETGSALLLTVQAGDERHLWSGARSALIVNQNGVESEQRASALAARMESAGCHVTIARCNEFGNEARGHVPELVVFLAGTTDDHIEPAKSLLNQCLSLKRLADTVGTRKATFWLVTSGALGTTVSSPSNDVAAGVWTFTRTLANEVPTLDVRRVDVNRELQPEELADRLCRLIHSGTDETEILLDRKVTKTVRFEETTTEGRRQGHQAEAARLNRGEGSGFDRFRWKPVPKQSPRPTEVEIAVEAIGLNFRDVMFGLGLLPEDILEHGFAGPTLGLECAGRVERIGSSVRNFKPGDRVIAFAKGAFATHVTTPASVVAAIPNDISTEMAATIPVAFLTAYYALIICARLKPAEWVLIHGGAGGVGLAAIQIARWRGARIIATAGSPEKRALLAVLGAEHVFDSRSGAFVDDIRRVTGDGVAVVLNSLSGEAMERSIGVLRPFGRFVELGKRDYVGNTHIGLRPFRRNLAYFGVDLDQILLDEPKTSKLLMRSVLDLFAKGHLRPLVYRAFDANDTIEAFRLMQQSGHIGKLVVRPPRPEDIASSRQPSFQISADKIHLITGGGGGFGLEVARWLAENGAKHILLAGRSGARSQAAQETLSVLAAKGVLVRVETLDIADKPAVQHLFARFGLDLPALGGVIHAAMVLDDAMLTNVTAERFAQVLRPKVTGADNLDQLTQSLNLDYFVMFSSATTLVGNPGQAAYVAANGYLEGLARRRWAAGLPALTICWGAIEDVGVLARSGVAREALANRIGIKGMQAQDALSVMGKILGAPASDDNAVVAVAPMDWSAARQHLAVLRSPSYKKLTSRGDLKANEQSRIDIAALLAQNSADDAREMIGRLIVDEIAQVLRLPREDIARTTPLAEIGLDSLMAAELALGLEERFKLDAPLSTTAGGFTVNELADHVIGLAIGTTNSDEAVTRTMIERHLGPATDRETIETANELIKGHAETRSILN
jgi:phthiocerol/phenolphthiocerol synthesis type-I polyketide synthase C